MVGTEGTNAHHPDEPPVSPLLGVCSESLRQNFPTRKQLKSKTLKNILLIRPMYLREQSGFNYLFLFFYFYFLQVLWLWEQCPPNQNSPT